MNSILFLDRDGVINKKREDYVKNIQEFEFLPGIFDAIKKINDLDISIIVITNQSVINRKLVSENQLNEIHEFMQQTMKEKSCKILKIYFCPHHPKEKCTCRKPNTGMIEQAIEDYNIDLFQIILCRALSLKSSILVQPEYANALMHKYLYRPSYTGQSWLQLYLILNHVLY